MTRSHTRAESGSSKYAVLYGSWAALLLAASGALAAPPRQSLPAQMEAEFRSTYSLSAPASAQLAGVRLAKLVLPGLHISERSEHAPDDGGVVLSYADRGGSVRVLVRITVAADAAAARRVLDIELHGVAAQLTRASDGMLGDLAWADDEGRGASLVVAALGNVAYSVSVIDPGLGVPTAAAIAGILRAAVVPGVPSFPIVRVSLPSVIDPRLGTPVTVDVPGGFPYKLRAEGAYIARGTNGPVVRPFAVGTVVVHATVADELGRVAVTSAATSARSNPEP